MPGRAATSNGDPRREALIVGAGIGGLSAALALAKSGWRVRILERSAALDPIGAGIQLGPNATRILDHWGVLDALCARSFQPQALQSRDWHSGRVLSHTALGAAAIASWGAPYLQIHRADLQDVLHQAALDAGCELLFNRAASHIDLDARQLQCEDGKRLNGDLIIGADGIRSVVQAALFGPSEARFTGQSAWRLLVPASDDNALPPFASLWMGPGRHLVHYYVDSGRLINIVGVVEQSEWREESWTAPADFAAVQSDFAGAHPDILALIARARDLPCYRWGLFDRPALPQWHRGQVALLGDACHPMLPFLAQGAAMAIEDAWVLAQCLRGAGAIPAALDRYTALRKPRADWVQAASRRNARIFHLRGIMAWARNLALRSGLVGPARLTRRLYGYRPEGFPGQA